MAEVLELHLLFNLYYRHNKFLESEFNLYIFCTNYLTSSFRKAGQASQNRYLLNFTKLVGTTTAKQTRTDICH